MLIESLSSECHSEHGVGFATTGLAVCENSAIVSIEYILNEGERGLLVDLLLGRCLVKDTVIGEVLDGRVVRRYFFQADLVTLFIN